MLQDMQGEAPPQTRITRANMARILLFSPCRASRPLALNNEEVVMNGTTFARAAIVFTGLVLAAWVPAHAQQSTAKTPAASTPTSTTAAVKQAQGPSSKATNQPAQSRRQQRLRDGQCTGQGPGHVQGQRKGQGRGMGQAAARGNGNRGNCVRPRNGQGKGAGATASGGPGSARCDGSGRAQSKHRGGKRRGGRG